MADDKEDREIFAALEKESNDFEKVSSLQPASMFSGDCVPFFTYLSLKDYSKR
jgi:hypothetical protein